MNAEVKKPEESSSPEAAAAEPTEKAGTAGPSAVGRMTSLQAWRDEFDRLFDGFLESPFSRRLFELDPFRRRGVALGDVTPRVDVVETAQTLEVTAELPGLKEDDIEITVGDRVLTLRGEKKVERDQTEGGFHVSERSYGSFIRSFPLPETVDEEGIEATYDRGVLKVTLRKIAKETPQRRKIEVKTKA